MSRPEVIVERSGRGGDHPVDSELVAQLECRGRFERGTEAVLPEHDQCVDDHVVVVARPSSRAELPPSTSASAAGSRGDRLRRRVGIVPAVEQDRDAQLATSPHQRDGRFAGRVRQGRRRMELQAAEAVLIDGSAQRRVLSPMVGIETNEADEPVGEPIDGTGEVVDRLRVAAGSR